MKRRRAGEAGFTLVELTVAIVVMSVIAIGLVTLFQAVIQSIVVARRQAVGLTLATTQLEYLKSLPYDKLAVQGGAIYATALLPATKTQTVNGVKYTVTTSIAYVDDAYDGCATYSTQAQKETDCRNYPSPTGAPNPDQNPADYKIIHVSTTDASGKKLAAVDTQITARVAESASTTGALFVTVLDQSGAPIVGATVTVKNTTITPAANLGDVTNTNGRALFYNLPPDTGNDYVVTATKTGFSSLSTIAAGTLQPTYPNQKILAQQSSSVTLQIAPMSAQSMVLETTDLSGNPLPGMKVYAKGGYKKYIEPDDTTYYYDTMSPTDSRVTTDGTGIAVMTGLAPVGEYIFCGDTGATGCQVGGTTYYLAAAVPYGGANSLRPIGVPPMVPTNPPPATYTHGGVGYLQKVRLMFSTNPNLPRIFTMSPYQFSTASATNSDAFLITFTGENLSGATVSLAKDGVTYEGSGCMSSATQLKCSFNLTGMSVGLAQLTLTNAAGSLTLPTTPRGGFDAAP